MSYVADSPKNRHFDPISGRFTPIRSGKEVRLPSPPPLRTVHAPFNAYGSSIGQRAFSKHAVGPIGLGVHLGVTTAVPATEIISVAEAAPARIMAIPPTDLHCLLRRLADGSRPPTPRGSRLAFARGDLATPIRPMTGRLSLPPRSFTRSPIGSPCGSSTLTGGLRAYHVASRKLAWVRSRLYAGGSSSAPGELATSGPGHVPFGQSLSAPLACSD
jgi:hypothetical protein